MRVCTIEQMQQLDKLTIEKYGVAGEILMERAGRWCTLVAIDILKNLDGKSVCVLTGRGNNGGDGFVVARHLHKIGYNVQNILVAEPDKLTGDALLNFNRAKDAKVPWHRFDGNIPQVDLIVDALLGTGISGAPRGELADAIDKINEIGGHGAMVIAVDIASGVNGNEGSASGVAVNADATVTFGFPKLGQFIHPGRMLTGELFIGDIGIDKRAESEVSVSHQVATINEIAELLPKRPDDGHKGTFGKALIIAGSAGMTGAAAMASISLLRSGAGLCYTAVPRSLVDTLDCAAMETVVIPMPEVRKSGCHTLRALGELHKRAKAIDAIAIGPGLGTHTETREMVRKFLMRLQKPVVIDADGLNALAGTIDDVIPQITAPSVMTPHMGELARLISMPIDNVAQQRTQKAADWAETLFTTLVIKGNPTLIAGKNETIWINPTGNNGMGTGGSGDVLTGLITGFLAQGLDPRTASIVGTYIHGLAGDIAAEKFTRRAMIAGDIMNCIPDAFTEIENIPPDMNDANDELGLNYYLRYLGSQMTLLYAEFK